MMQGQGYQAPAELQLADGREGVSQCNVVRPLRDISRKELALVCHFAQVPFQTTPELPRAPRSVSVNGLSASFLSLLQVRLQPSAACGGVLQAPNRPLRVERWSLQLDCHAFIVL